MDPLRGVNIVEFTQYIAGPHCTQLLEALGADAVKIEPPGGEPGRDGMSQFSSHNRGKRSIALDLTSEDGHGVAMDLVERADVLVHNYTPGTIEKLGLDYETIAAVNEDVVYCSITGFGADGPYSEYAAIDPIAQAASGIMAYLGYPELPNIFDGRAYTTGHTFFVDIGTGTNAAFAILAAIRERDRTGEGEFLDVSLYDVAVSYMAEWIVKYTRGDDRVPRRTDTQNTFETYSEPSGVFSAGDGKPLLLSVTNDRIFERFCDAIDDSDLLEDERFATIDARKAHAEALHDRLDDAFASYDRTELFERLGEAAVPAAPVQDVVEVVEEDPHAAAREMIQESVDGRGNEPVKTASLPIKTSGGRLGSHGPPPELGGDTRAILSEAGYADERIDELVEAGVLPSNPG